ncbi:hypothetical protein U27_06742 [Candidatus Vecturithrix granuli]|uniref:Uncharacterized protein n=1 Tax=Vecturithrix granuli TaxID=1499967 RepID=A0A081C5A2_VECG1|nr:hypothetical protein U27_06742 [Candidatus Vecturithrix granuli]
MQELFRGILFFSAAFLNKEFPGKSLQKNMEYIFSVSWLDFLKIGFLQEIRFLAALDLIINFTNSKAYLRTALSAEPCDGHGSPLVQLFSKERS